VLWRSSYEKRKQAALEIEQLVKELNAGKAAIEQFSQAGDLRALAGEEKEKNKESIKSIIGETCVRHCRADALLCAATLVNDYAFSTQANHRKGGLIGLAATAIALMDVRRELPRSFPFPLAHSARALCRTRTRT
jgi:vacuole morphology and inheritance protein 14